MSSRLLSVSHARGLTSWNSKLLIKTAQLIQHLVGWLSIGVKLLSNRIDWFRQGLNIRLVVALSSDRSCGDFWRFWNCRSWAPVGSSPEHFGLDLLFLSLKLRCLLHSHEVFAHTFLTFANVEVLHVVALNLSFVSSRLERCIFFLYPLILGPDSLFLEF